MTNDRILIGEADELPPITRSRPKLDPEEAKRRRRAENLSPTALEAQRLRDRKRDEQPERKKKKRLYDKTNPARLARKKQWRRKLNKNDKIVAWDGEGLEERLPDLLCVRGRHRYVILQDSEGTEIRNRNGLGTTAILDSLWKTHTANPQAWHVGYGLEYDWNNWLKDVTKETARDLYEGKRVKLGEYAVRFPGLWFELEKDGQRVVIWDVWRFWQFSFEKAVKKTIPDFPDIGIITKGKERRADREWHEIEDMAIYNRTELKALVQLTKELAILLEQAGIPMPSFLTGAGALAGSLARKHGVQYHNAPLPPEVDDAIMRAFAAGRIEAWQIGHTTEPLYTADIRSAYPDAQRWLPSFSGGEWEKVDSLHEDWNSRMAVYHVRWDWISKDKPLSRRYYPFPWRKKDGSVFFPPAGEGWVMWPEVMVAKQLGWKFEIVEGWKLRIGSKFRPFAFQEKMYDFRKTLRERGLEGAVQELKLAMNAVYGKTCQARGSLKSKPPQLTNFAWAAWTTSFVRAKMDETVQQNPEAVVYQMTDSICSTAPLKVDEGTGLGQWECETWKNGGTVVQAGIAWLRDLSKPPPDDLLLKVRGFNKNDFELHADEWEDEVLLRWLDDAHRGERKPLSVPTKRPITLGSALQGNRWNLFNQWEEVPREMDLYGGGGKRLYLRELKTGQPWKRMEPLEPARGLVDLATMTLQGEAMSTPHEPAWAKEDYRDMEPIEGKLDDELLELSLIEAGELA